MYIYANQMQMQIRIQGQIQCTFKENRFKDEHCDATFWKKNIISNNSAKTNSNTSTHTKRKD